jgi:cytochrome c biogenesis protein CcmG, thiol:disulfide interchange protein DsbE
VRPSRALRRGVALVSIATIGALCAIPAPHRDAMALEAAKAPAFRIKDLDGHTVELKTLLARGPVLLDFWATWCKPCHAAIPELESWRKAYAARGLTIVGVSVDGPRNHAKVRPFVARAGIHYPVVIDEDGKIQQRYQVLALPTAVLIDREGNIVSTRIGFDPAKNTTLEASIGSLLPEHPEATDSPAAPDSASR